ncbi:hypothetical protein DAPPUDRAFT_302138 [Daphnia pulex]|uniref:VIT domain-containing protein n=1 Tax=Daphnia pulex TaxID=6669 RepID=E9GBR1_DAPPU|nr:hypothetical protein DAPPUDRAFT_302138 [Daphnia pulex]|eukprot:EFX83005.1 hypothetical protein DAPPUDRAFT_302138 [Daphnia pulex]
MICCGLIIERAERESIPVPLIGVSVQARIVDLVAEVTIEQRYVNKENQPIEAVYLFPLDEGAGVSKFTAEVDGRLIEGVVKETEQAKTDYDQAIKSGHSAFLVEEKLPDVFKAKVGNLAPGSGAKIRLTYVTELKVEGKEIRFYLPTTIAPRYIPPTDKSSTAADLASIKYSTESNYQVDFNATVQMASAITEIRSPTHKIAVTRDVVNKPQYGTLRFDNVVTSMDRDLVVYIQVAEPNQPRLICEKSPKGTTALMLSLVPSFKLTEQKTELIFLVDRSGSMGGSGINQAKQALQLFLHSLPLDCYVNIAGFGSSYEELFPTSRKYDETVLNLAKQHVDSIDANLGGTEIFHPLEIIFKKPSIEGYLRQIFVLTDGEVSNADEILGLIRRQNGQARVFALGLGSSASHYLVEGMARAGNGTALFASLEERLEKKVMQQLQDSLQPALSDIKIIWDGHEETGQMFATAKAVPVQTEKTLMGYGKPLESMTPVPTEKPQLKFRQAPTADMVPAVFDGKHLIVYALLTEDAHVPKWAEVIAKSPVGPLTLKVHLDESNSDEGQLIHCLAAKKLIQALQDSEGDPDSIEDSKSTETKQEIIQLGCQYGLASRYTSYVAIDPKEQKELKESWMMMKSRDVPVQFAHGWGGYQVLGGFAGGCGPMMGRSNCPPMAMACHYSLPPGIYTDGVEQVGGGGGEAYESCSDNIEELDCEVDDDYCDNEIQFTLSPSEGTENETSNTDDDKLLKLITCQHFDGSFKLESALAELLHTTLEDIKQAAEKNSYSEQVWATAVALAFMGIALADLQTTWMLVAKKAENWIRSSGKLTGDETACTSAAQEYVKAKLSL